MRELITKRNLVFVLLCWLLLNTIGLIIIFQIGGSFHLPTWPDLLRRTFYLFIGYGWVRWFHDLFSVALLEAPLFVIIPLIQIAILVTAIWLWFKKPTLFRAFLLSLAGIFGGPYLGAVVPCRFGFPGFWPDIIMLSFYLVLFIAKFLYWLIAGRQKTA